MRASLAAGTCLVLLATLAGSTDNSDRTLDEATDLLSGPEGARVAVLLPGATLHVLESRPGWMRVEMEGWIRAGETPPSATPTQAAPAMPDAGASRGAPGSMAGAVFITDQKGRTTIGAGMALRLLQDPQGAAAKVAAIGAECKSSTASLRAEAEALKAEGARAMKTIENPTQAFEAYDEAKRKRGVKLRELEALDDECGQRKELALDSFTIQRSLSDPQGRYAFEQIPAGTYTLHGMLEAADIRHEWDLEVVVESGKRVGLDLTNANRSRTSEAPVYR